MQFVAQSYLTVAYLYEELRLHEKIFFYDGHINSTNDRCHCNQGSELMSDHLGLFDLFLLAPYIMFQNDEIEAIS